MDLSIFDIVGPVMVGLSSSHTAGTAKLARIAAQIAGNNFIEVSFGLHGSLAKTGQGHGTPKALLAGAIGIYEDDERLRDAYLYAKAKNIKYSFYEAELDDCHENTALITFKYKNGKERNIQGSSIGGGRIVITKIDGTDTNISAECPTIMLTHRDIPGMVSEISRVLTENNINIGIMRVSRKIKGDKATTVIETDSVISDDIVGRLERINGILNVCVINPTYKEAQ